MTYEEMGRAKLKNRAERLVRLINLEAPATILASEAILILKAAIMVESKMVANGLREVLVSGVRSESRCCVDCGISVEWEEKYCVRCANLMAAGEENPAKDDIDID